MIKTPKDKVSYGIICDKFPEPHAYFSTYDLALRWLKLEQPNNRPHYIVKRTEHYEICDDKNIEETPAANISEEFAKAVRSWLVNYQVKCAELEGRYTPYEILGWIVSDWRKENGIW